MQDLKIVWNPSFCRDCRTVLHITQCSAPTSTVLGRTVDAKTTHFDFHYHLNCCRLDTRQIAVLQWIRAADCYKHDTQDWPLLWLVIKVIEPTVQPELSYHRIEYMACKDNLRTSISALWNRGQTRKIIWPIKVWSSKMPLWRRKFKSSRFILTTN